MFRLAWLYTTVAKASPKVKVKLHFTKNLYPTHHSLALLEDNELWIRVGSGGV
jgi:hypothetical protein